MWYFLGFLRSWEPHIISAPQTKYWLFSQISDCQANFPLFPPTTRIKLSNILEKNDNWVTLRCLCILNWLQGRIVDGTMQFCWLKILSYVFLPHGAAFILVMSPCLNGECCGELDNTWLCRKILSQSACNQMRVSVRVSVSAV